MDLRHLRVTHTTDKETQYYYFAAKMRLTLLANWALVGTFQGKALSKR